LAFGGDIHFADQLEPLLSKPQTALAELRPHLGAADVAVVNLEAALTTRGSPAPKAFHFRSPPTALQALAAAGVDVVTMANNHAVDYGAKGFADTLAARAKSPVPVVGIGTNTADALRPAIVTIRGRRVAVLGATQVPDWTLATWPAGDNRPGVAAAANPRRLADAVRRARRSADVVVVYLHWGTDYERCPNSLQRSTARALAAAGADVVVGTHAHQVQGAGWLRSTYVAYGLGNFVWWRRNDELQSRSGVLTLTVRGRRVVGERWTPMRISADGLPRVPAKARGRPAPRELERARGLHRLVVPPRLTPQSGISVRDIVERLGVRPGAPLLATIECRQRLDVRGLELEVEQREVLGDPRRGRRLRKDDVAALEMPAQHYLRRRPPDLLSHPAITGSPSTRTLGDR
jgi:poly-gamma-glutamate synthesis protein (capsule biosynthesis protein)